MSTALGSVASSEYLMLARTVTALWDRTDKDISAQQRAILENRLMSRIFSTDGLDIRPGEFVRAHLFGQWRAIVLGTYLGPLAVYEVPPQISPPKKDVDKIAFLVSTPLARSGMFRKRYEGDQFVFAIERRFGLSGNRNLH